MSAGIGFIAVFVVPVLNGVVMVSFINQLRTQRMALEECYREGCTHPSAPGIDDGACCQFRLRLDGSSTGTGAEVQRPLATVVTGGLITSTLLTLVVLLVIWV